MTKTLTLAILLILAAIMLPAPAAAQAGAFYSAPILTTCNPPTGNLHAICGLPGVTVRVCAGSAVGTPCTPLATLYTDVTLATACTGINGCSNPAVPDAQGNVGFFAPSGFYILQYVYNGSVFYQNFASLGGSGGSGSSAFSAILPGVNTIAAMVVGTGASLSATGSGVVAATSVPAAGVAIGTLQNGMNAVTQAVNDNSNNLATTAYADAVNPAVGATGTVQTTNGGGDLAGSNLNDNGSQFTVNESGGIVLTGVSSGPWSVVPEQTDPALGVSGSDTIWASSITHHFGFNGNAGTNLYIPGIAGAITAGHVFVADTNGIDLVDGGAPGTGTVINTAALTLNSITLGAGSSAISPGPVGTSNNVLHGVTSGAPVFGKVVAADTDNSVAHTGADINTSNQVTVTHLAAALPLAQGGVATTSVPTNGQLLIGNGTGYTVASLTAGTNVTITPGAGSLTIAASGGGGGAPIFPVTSKTTTYTATASDFANFATFEVPSGTFTLNLVSSGTGLSNGQGIWIINYGAGTVTVGRGGLNINGSATNLSLPSTSGAFILFDGTNYLAQTFVTGGTGVTSWNTRTGAVVPADSDYTLTQIAAGTAKSGSTINLLEDKWFNVAVCQATGPSLGGSFTSIANAPSAICSAGSSTTPTSGQAVFTSSATYATRSVMEWQYKLPSDFVSLTAANVLFNNQTDTNAAHSVIWDLELVCIASLTGAQPPTYGSVQNFTTAHPVATPGATNNASLSNPSGSCSPNNDIYLRLSLDNSSTTTAGDVALQTFKIQYKRAEVTQ